MNFKKILFLSIAFLFVSYSAWAIPAYPFPVKVTLSDGTQITLQTFGDEHHHYTTTSDGYTVVQKADGFFYYATLGSDGYLAASTVRANDPKSRTSEETKFLSKINTGIVSQLSIQNGNMRAQEANEERAKRVEKRMKMNQENATLSDVTSERALVLLVNFSDVSFTKTSTPQASVNSLLNQVGYTGNGAEGSAKDYFSFNSNGQYDITFDVKGPYTVSQTQAYYGARTSTGNDSYPGQMVKEACQLAYDDGVNFSDYAVGGEVPNLIVIYAGYGEADSGIGNTIWPHEWNLQSATGSALTLNGVKINTYACSQEINASTDRLTGIGVICHEFGHVLGLPDFYDTDYATNGNALALSYTSLMASGAYVRSGNVPPSFNAVERNLSGWLEYTDINTVGTMTLKPVYEPMAYRMKTEVDDEYFVFEYRNGSDNVWDAIFANGDSTTGVVAGEGMMVYHFDRSNNIVYNSYTAKQMWTYNMVNAIASRECMRIVTSTPNVSSSTTNFSRFVFPGTANATNLSKETTPALVSWAGNGLDLAIYDITVNSDAVTFRVADLNTATQIQDVTTTPSQNSIRIDVVSEEVGNWTVKYNKTGDDANVSSIEVSGLNVFSITQLEPNTSYDITVHSTTNTTNSKTVTGVTTQALTSGLTRINMDSTYSLSQNPVIVFDVVNIQNEYSSIRWLVNSASSQAYRAFTATGRYQIRCLITYKDGTVENLIRYITVQ